MRLCWCGHPADRHHDELGGCWSCAHARSRYFQPAHTFRRIEDLPAPVVTKSAPKMLAGLP